MVSKTSHFKVEVFSHSAQTLSHLFRDSVQTGITPNAWSQGQSKDPIIRQISEVMHNKTIAKWKFKPDVDFDLKSLIMVRKQLKIGKDI